MDATLSLPPITDRIIALIAVLSQAVIDRERVPGMTASAFAYITGKLLGIHLRFRAVLARIAQGKIRPEKPRKKRVRKPRPEDGLNLPPGYKRWLPKHTKEQPIWRVLRTDRFAWLCNVVATIPGFRQSAAICGTHLRRLLDDPEMRAILAASRRVGDALRPLCWMLGVETSLLYPKKPPAGVDDVSAPTPAAAVDDGVKEQPCRATVVAPPSIAASGCPPSASLEGPPPRVFSAA